MALVSPDAIVDALLAGQPLPGKAARRDPAWTQALVRLAQTDPDHLDALWPHVAPVRVAQALAELVKAPAISRVFHAFLAQLDPWPRRPEQETALALAYMPLIYRPLQAEATLQPGRADALAAALQARDPDDPLGHSRIGLALRQAMENGSFDAVYPLVRHHWAPQPSDHPLIETALEQAQANTPIGTTIDLLPDTPPEAAGRLLVSALLDGNEFVRRSLKDDQYRWPLDVVGALDGRYSRSAEPIQEQRWAYIELDRLFQRSDLSDDLKDRLLEACRPLRPHVGEDRFRAQDRVQALNGRAPSRSRSRPRS